MMLVGDVSNRICILIDDLADTSNTITRAAKLLKKEGATKVYALLTHGVLSGDAIERINASALDKVVVTNSVPQEEHMKRCPKLEVLEIGEIFAEVSGLLGEWSGGPRKEVETCWLICGFIGHSESAPRREYQCAVPIRLNRGTDCTELMRPLFSSIMTRSTLHQMDLNLEAANLGFLFFALAIGGFFFVFSLFSRFRNKIRAAD